MKLKHVTFLILSILLFHQTNGQGNFKSIIINSDTVRSSLIKEQIKNDSIIILEYQKIRYDDMPDIFDERVVYLDFQRTNLREEISKVKKQLKSIISGESYLGFYKTDNIVNIKNQNKEIINIFIPAYKLNNNYIVFLPDFDHPRIISDTAFMYKDDEGLMLYYFQDVNKENDIYKLTFDDFQHNISKKEIQLYDRDKKIQAWKETHIGGNNKEFINYSLYVPLEEAIKYPALNIRNTGGLDDVYDKFDKIDLEKIFN